MSAAEARERYKTISDKRIKKLLRNGHSNPAIAASEGVDEGTVKKLRKAMGLPAGKRGSTPVTPLGLTSASSRFRKKLGDHLNTLARNFHVVEIAWKTGVSQKQQTYSKAADPTHDWQLSQLERLAAELDTPLLDLVLELFRPTGSFDKKEIEKWNETIARSHIGKR